MRHTFVYEEAQKQIGSISNRELFLAGLILYWAEYAKASRDLVCLTNTDQAMLSFFITCLELNSIPRSK